MAQRRKDLLKPIQRKIRRRGFLSYNPPRGEEKLSSAVTERKGVGWINEIKRSTHFTVLSSDAEGLKYGGKRKSRATGHREISPSSPDACAEVEQVLEAGIRK